MAEQDSAQEKTEQPTPRKIQKAREDGSIARSRELNTTVVLLAAAFSMLVFGGSLARTAQNIMRFSFSFDPRASWDTSIAGEYFMAMLLESFLALVPIFALLLLAAVLAPVGLGGWNLSLKTLVPKGSRLNPLSGLQRMFSLNSVVELLKSWGKVLIVATAALIVLVGLKNQFLAMVFQPTEEAIAAAALILVWSFLLIAASTILIALIDVPYQLYSHTKKLRMSMQEIKEEFKNTEGKPEVKAKIKQLQRELANRRMMTDVPEADVIITNPTHYAVALKYQPSTMPAPLLVAKGVDQIALKIKEIGGEYQVPIIELPALARAIYHHTAIGAEIPEGLYIAVAQVLAYVYQVDQWQRGLMPKKPPKPTTPIPDELREDE